jgi:hypothetical protein
MSFHIKSQVIDRPFVCDECGSKSLEGIVWARRFKNIFVQTLQCMDCQDVNVLDDDDLWDMFQNFSYNREDAK